MKLTAFLIFLHTLLFADFDLPHILRTTEQKSRWAAFCPPFLYAFLRRSITSANVSDAFAFASIDGVRVNVQRRGNVGVTEPACNRDHVHAVSDQHRGVRVPESVRMQVREVMTLCELAQPACEAVRVNRCAIVFHKQKTAILPAVAALEPKLIVLRPVFPQKLHSLFRERKKRRVLRLRRAFVNAELREVKK